jgi:5-methylthioadenosine/S-adenosylhomocysteine deaminase
MWPARRFPAMLLVALTLSLLVALVAASAQPRAKPARIAVLGLSPAPPPSASPPVVAAGAGHALGGGYLIRDAALVLTMDPRLGDGILGELENADVLIEDDKIVAVGRDLPKPPGTAMIDGRGMIVMPGFVDTHEHTMQSIIRGCAADDTVVGWLARCTSGIRAANPTEREMYAAARLHTVGLIDSGVTTVNDWIGRFLPPVYRGDVRALVDSKLRFAVAVFGFATDGTDLVATVNMVKQDFIDGNPLATLQIASSPNPGTAAHVAVASQLALDRGLKLHVHLLENIADLGANQLQVLQNNGAFALGRDLHVAHFVHASDADIATIAGLNASVAHNPLSNMRLASGIMRYPEIRNAGIRIGLGLDGGTNDTTDMFNNMRVAVGLQRAKSLNALGSPTIAEVLRAATLGGAEVLDMESQIGSLTPGKQADVIVIDPRALNFAPSVALVNQLITNGQPQNVQYVFVAGQPLKSNGRLVGVNVGTVIKDAQTAADRIAPFLAP